MNRYLLASICLLAGCPTPAPIDGGADAPLLGDGGMADAPMLLDTSVADAPDASIDAAGMDGGMPLPAIVNPDPHTVAASSAGHDRFYGVTFAPDSSFYVVGVAADSTEATADFRTIVVHFDAAGELDPTFGTDGVASVNLAVGTNGELTRGIGLQSDGAIVVSATIEATGAADPRDRDIAIARLLPTGALDMTFGDMGVRRVDLSLGELDGTTFRADSAYGLAIDAMDRVVVSAERRRDDNADMDWVVVRLTADGALDTTFATTGIFSMDLEERNARTRGIRVLGSGRIVASGYYDLSGSGTVVPVVFALTSAGILDTTFGGGDGIYTETVLAIQTEAYDVAIVGDQLVTSGYGRDTGSQNDLISLRLNGDGTRDLSYGPEGANGVVQLTSFLFADNARALHELPGGGTIHVGASRTTDTPSPQADAAIWVLDADGALNAAFDGDGFRGVNTAPGTTDHFWAVAVDPRGERVVTVGIGGTDPATDDDGLVYLFEAP